MTTLWFPLQLVGALAIFVLFLEAIAFAFWLFALYDVARRVRGVVRCYFRGAC